MDFRLVRRQQLVCFAHLKQTAQPLQCSAELYASAAISPFKLSVFPLDYGQSRIRGAAFNEQISPSARIASYRKSDS